MARLRGSDPPAMPRRTPRGGEPGALDDDTLEEFHESCALRSGTVLPVVRPYRLTTASTDVSASAGSSGLPLWVVGGESSQRCQVAAGRTPSGDNEFGVSSEFGGRWRAPTAIAAFTSVI